MKIRPIKIEDVPSVARIAAMVFPCEVAFAEFDIRSGINDWAAGGYTYCEQILVEIECVIIGFAGCYRLSDTPPNACGVNWMAVHPDFQRQQIGSVLLNMVEGIARKNYEIMFVYADLPAVSFYMKRGYSEDDLGMEKIEATKILSKPLLVVKG